MSKSQATRRGRGSRTPNKERRLAEWRAQKAEERRHDELDAELFAILGDAVDEHVPTAQDAVLPSPDDVAAAQTPAGGWTRAQLAEWGVAWPPRKGWRADLARRWHLAASGAEA